VRGGLQGRRHPAGGPESAAGLPEKTRPVLELFRAKAVIVAVEATGPAAQVETAICEQLGIEMSSA